MIIDTTEKYEISKNESDIKIVFSEDVTEKDINDVTEKIDRWNASFSYTEFSHVNCEKNLVSRIENYFYCHHCNKEITEKDVIPVIDITDIVK